MRSPGTSTGEWPSLATTRKSLSTAVKTQHKGKRKKKIQQRVLKQDGSDTWVLELRVKHLPFSPWLPRKHTHITPTERNSCHGPSALPGTPCCGQGRQSPGVTASRNSGCQQSHRPGCGHSSSLCCNESLWISIGFRESLDQMGR